MNKEFRALIYWFSLGASLIAYAHANFSSKEKVNSLHDDVREMRIDIKEIKAILIQGD